MFLCIRVQLRIHYDEDDEFTISSGVSRLYAIINGKLVLLSFNNINLLAQLKYNFDIKLE